MSDDAHGGGIAANADARRAILGRVRAALGVRAGDAACTGDPARDKAARAGDPARDKAARAGDPARDKAARAGDPAREKAAREKVAQDYVAAHAQGPRPAMPEDLVARFAHRVHDMSSTLERIASRDEIPHAVARYIDGLDLPDALAEQRSRLGVCWPDFADLDWDVAGLAIETRPTQGHDRLGITGVFCAIAETGTLVFTSGAATPTASAILPDTHVAVVRESQVVSGMEEAFARVRARHATWPRAINFMSGPSRTGDIEQTIVLGAHGPFRVHVLLLPG
jgi:L-lactate dehydrogenase complex protein LldG